MLTHIDLFSGIGGFALAAQWAGFNTVAFVEIEPYAQEIIKQNFGAMADAEKRCTKDDGQNKDTAVNAQWLSRLGCHVSGAPRIYGHIRSFDGTQYRGATLLTGGFPCQPFSQAGKRRGKEDDRYLWPEMLRVISEARPAWVLGENVAGIATMELDRVLSDLESEGYTVQSLIIPACAVDAKHRRDRVWIVGHAGSEGSLWGSHAGIYSESESAGSRVPLSERRSEDMADTGLRRGERPRDEIGGGEQPARWLAESNVGRVAHGVRNRVDRLKGLGNAIVPQVAFEILKGIAEIESQRP